MPQGVFPWTRDTLASVAGFLLEFDEMEEDYESQLDAFIKYLNYCNECGRRGERPADFATWNSDPVAGAVKA